MGLRTLAGLLGLPLCALLFFDGLPFSGSLRFRALVSLTLGYRLPIGLLFCALLFLFRRSFSRPRLLFTLGFLSLGLLFSFGFLGLLFTLGFLGLGLLLGSSFVLIALCRRALTLQSGFNLRQRRQNLVTLFLQRADVQRNIFIRLLDFPVNFIEKSSLAFLPELQELDSVLKHRSICQFARERSVPAGLLRE
ncbi:hypothetical protein OS189_02500 [Sulfitobacter sp. F26169L]|uniref:hypothetical protein n=1 Tax=Sulfitobacter sp. F26169L TaxID=2996015 RepID=UPI002260996E|nr:hypothetical protein [Sulfitobacter sp. F26169L]MCX7565214.1 hypothetical protein [Sulfitobacter sp. F26169L]